MTVYEHIAINNHNKAAGLVTAAGLRPFRDPGQMAQQLRAIVRERGEDGLRKVMDIHPDKAIILELFGAKNNADGGAPISYSNCVGCGGKCGGGMNNACGCSASADGETTAPKPSGLGAVPVSTILIGALLLTTAVVLVRMK